MPNIYNTSEELLNPFTEPNLPNTVRLSNLIAKIDKKLVGVENIVSHEAIVSNSELSTFAITQKKVRESSALIVTNTDTTNNTIVIPPMPAGVQTIIFIKVNDLGSFNKYVNIKFSINTNPELFNLYSNEWIKLLVTDTGLTFLDGNDLSNFNIRVSLNQTSLNNFINLTHPRKFFIKSGTIIKPITVAASASSSVTITLRHKNFLNGSINNLIGSAGWSSTPSFNTILNMTVSNGITIDSNIGDYIEFHTNAITSAIPTINLPVSQHPTYIL